MEELGFQLLCFIGDTSVVILRCMCVGWVLMGVKAHHSGRRHMDRGHSPRGDMVSNVAEDHAISQCGGQVFSKGDL